MSNHQSTIEYQLMEAIEEAVLVGWDKDFIYRILTSDYTPQDMANIVKANLADVTETIAILKVWQLKRSGKDSLFYREHA